MSDFESTFNNSSNLESKFLWRVRFLIDLFCTCEIWIDYFTMHQMLQENFCGNSKFSEKTCPRKKVSLSHLTPWKRQSWHFRAFSHIVILIKFCEKSTFFQSIFSSSFPVCFKFLKTCENLDQDIYSYIFCSNILELVKTLIEDLVTCQIIKVSGELFVQKSIFGLFRSAKMSKNACSRSLEKHDSEETTLQKKHILNIYFIRNNQI